MNNISNLLKILLYKSPFLILSSVQSPAPCSSFPPSPPTKNTCLTVPADLYLLCTTVAVFQLGALVFLKGNWKAGKGKKITRRGVMVIMTKQGGSTFLFHIFFLFLFFFNKLFWKPLFYSRVRKLYL